MPMTAVTVKATTATAVTVTAVTVTAVTVTVTGNLFSVSPESRAKRQD